MSTGMSAPRWAELVGAEHVRPGTGADAVDGVMPPWVVRPGTVTEVQMLLQAALREHAAVVPRGLGAHLDVGAPPRRLDALVVLDRLARVVAHEAADMTVTVEAGCPLAVLDGVLAAAGQWLPLDPPRPDATTVGGLVAANLSGPLRASQGTARDLLLGLRWVDAAGALVAGGGRVVKNVAGYDLPKLHVGALGTMGVLVEATFKVRPRPPAEAAVVIAARSATAAVEVALAVRDAMDPLWLEVAGPGGLADGPGDGAAAVVGVGGGSDEVEHGCALAAGVAERHGCRAVPVRPGTALRGRLAGFDAEPAAAVLRAAALPADTGRVMEDVETCARAQGVTVRCLAHAANGVVRVAVATPAAVAPLVAALRPRLEGRDGSLVVHRAAAAVKVGLDVWGAVGDGLPLMRRLRAAFDPDGVLAPGRFIGDAA